MNKSNLTEYRAELMGIAAIGVLLTHSGSFVNWNGIMKHIVIYGGLGVYFFMFLSAIGLFYSISSRGGTLLDFTKEE